jgi:hypothetical protein
VGKGIGRPHLSRPFFTLFPAGERGSFGGRAAASDHGVCELAGCFMMRRKGILVGACGLHGAGFRPPLTGDVSCWGSRSQCPQRPFCSGALPNHPLRTAPGSHKILHVAQRGNNRRQWQKRYATRATGRIQWCGWRTEQLMDGYALHMAAIGAQYRDRCGGPQPSCPSQSGR